MAGYIHTHTHTHKYTGHLRCCSCQATGCRLTLTHTHAHTGRLRCRSCQAYRATGSPIHTPHAHTNTHAHANTQTHTHTHTHTHIHTHTPVIFVVAHARLYRLQARQEERLWIPPGQRGLPLLLEEANAVVNLLLNCCCFDVTLVLHCCVVLLRCCYIVVTLVLHWCYIALFIDVTLLLHFCQRTLRGESEKKRQCTRLRLS
jgi:hypothetical protein